MPAGLDPVSTAAEALQFGVGLVQTISGSAKTNRLMGKRTTYKTPKEVAEVLQATQANAAEGFDATTLDYLNSQTDQAFSGYLGSAERLGADPNSLSAGFSAKMDAIMKIGSENHELNMKNFSTYLGAMDTMAANKTAEWQSREDLLKDKIQQAVQQKQEGMQNMGNAVNSFIGTQSAAKTSGLYNSDGTLKTVSGKIQADNTIQNPKYDSATGRLLTNA